MKKFYSIVLVAFAMLAIGCDEEEKPTPGGDNDYSVVGTWLLHHDDDFETLALKEGGIYDLTQSALYKEEGSYSYANNKLTITPSKAWERDYVRDDVHGGPVLDDQGNFQYTDWVETEPRNSALTYPVKFIYSGDVMLTMFDEASEEQGEVWLPYVKQNATHVSNISDIQGKWRWMNTRVIININGDQGDVIISPWGERYTGTIRYENGVIYFVDHIFRTTRYEDGEGGWEHLNEADPENSDWRIPDGGGTFEGGPEIGFVVDGNVAFGGVANLNARFEKE